MASVIFTYDRVLCFEEGISIRQEYQQVCDYSGEGKRLEGEVKEGRGVKN